MPPDDQFIRRHWNFTHRWAAHRCRKAGGRADPAAVTSDALLGLLRASRTWNPQGGRSENAWVTYVVDHAITDGFRQRYGDTRYQGRATVNQWVPWDDRVELVAKDDLDALYQRIDIHHALRHLEDREQLAVEAYYWDGWTLTEVGHVLGIGESATSLLLKRARAKMRRHLAVH